MPKKMKRSVRSAKRRTMVTYETYPKKFPRRNYVVLPKTIGTGASVQTNLRTSFFYNATATAGTGVWNGYLKPGSAYDPTGDLATIQPVQYDQWSTLFSRYKVNDCLIRVTVIGSAGGASTVDSWVFAAYPSVDITAAATYQAAASQPYAKCLVGGFQTSLIAATAYGIGTEPKKCSFKINNNTTVGLNSDAFDVGALVTADPTALQFAVLPMFLQANAVGAAKWLLQIDMFQNVTFSQRKTVADA